ncbi:hypothetical protein CC78DRAFT_589514 [Lojkania enalia]|uniref:Uncharacterized protein n=1 Tax=Lojkania enalia TaxID=147567 RepID=A0A9P4K3D1_9PLEO|nr:hypothetical protein CC78DRAFT_589514 [Didymosphaeria enalia]
MEYQSNIVVLKVPPIAFQELKNIEVLSDEEYQILDGAVKEKLASEGILRKIFASDLARKSYLRICVWNLYEEMKEQSFIQPSQGNKEDLHRRIMLTRAEKVIEQTQSEGEVICDGASYDDSSSSPALANPPDDLFSPLPSPRNAGASSNNFMTARPTSSQHPPHNTMSGPSNNAARYIQLEDSSPPTRHGHIIHNSLTVVYESGHVPAVDESIERDPDNPGRWLIRFKHHFENGKDIEQLDLLPILDLAAPRARYPLKGFYFAPAIPIIPIFDNEDNTQWEFNQKSGLWERFHSGDNEIKTAFPKFVVRKFATGTNVYVSQHIWGRKTDGFYHEGCARDFDINNAKCVEEYNLWVVKIQNPSNLEPIQCERHPNWSKEEMEALYDYGNELFVKHGIIKGFQEWNHVEATAKVERALLKKDPTAKPRTLRAVVAHISRDTLPEFFPERGIAEWRKVSRELKRRIKEGAKVPDHLLFPKKPLLSIDAAAKKLLVGNVRVEINRMRKLSDTTATEETDEDSDVELPIADDYMFKYTAIISGAVVLLPKAVPKKTQPNIAIPSSVAPGSRSNGHTGIEVPPGVWYLYAQTPQFISAIERKVGINARNIIASYKQEWSQAEREAAEGLLLLRDPFHFNTRQINELSQVCVIQVGDPIKTTHTKERELPEGRRDDERPEELAKLD